MEHYHRDQHHLSYFVELDGKREGDTCVEAQVSTKDQEGWVRRVWTVQEWSGTTKRDKKFYGKVYIVRFA